MIGVKGQYALGFTLGSMRDFINPFTFHHFQLSEEAGNNLPKFSLTFDTDKPSVLGMINEKQDLRVSMGQDTDSLIDTTLYIAESNVGPIDNFWRVECQGLLAKPGYLVNQKTGISDKKSGIETLLATAKKTFKVDSNVEQSSDAMNWIQHNVTDKEFINKLAMHAHLPGSYLAVAISALDNGTMVLRDVKKHLGQGPKWKLTQNPSAPGGSGNEIPYAGDYNIRNISGFINAFAGYARSQPTFDMESGKLNLPEAVKSVLMSAGNAFNQRGASGGVDMMRKALFQVKTENMHDNYHEARLNNMTNLALASSFKVHVNLARYFKPIRVLDSVYFREDNDKNPSEYASGMYLVSQVDRYFSASQHGTSLEITREAPGNMGK